MSTLTSIFDTPRSKLAIVDTAWKVKVTYQELHQQISNCCYQLAGLKIKKGDCVSLVANNSLEFVVAFLSTTFLGCTSAPLNANFTSSEFEFYLEDSKSKIAIIQESLLADKPDHPLLTSAKKLNISLIILKRGSNGLQLQPYGSNAIPVQVSKGTFKFTPEPRDTCLLLHTSGTTGRPKAVPLSHLNISRTMQNIVQTYKLTEKDTTYLVMPLFHVHGLIGALLSTLLSGGTAVIPQKFSASIFWEEYIANNCTWYSAVPTIHQILLNLDSPPKDTTIRFIRSCSSSLAPVTFQKLEKKFGAPVLEAYAMTEAAHQMTSNPLPPASRKPGSVGIPQGVEIAILDESGNKVEEGEVCIRGINVTSGYLNNKEANASSYTKDNFFRTGDQGKLDSDGYLFLTGRIKELINRGGEKISPLEIDSVLLKHSAVAEAVCFAVPDEKYGQEVQAAIRLNKDAKCDEDQLRQHSLKHLAEFKIPKKFYITNALPKTATGKIQRRKMVEHFINKPKL